MKSQPADPELLGMTTTPPFNARVTQGLQASFRQPSGPPRAGTDWGVSLTDSGGERRIVVRTYADELGELSQAQEVEVVRKYVGRLLRSGWSPDQYCGEPGELVAGGASASTPQEAARRPKRLTALSIVRAGVIGVAAVALPSAAYGAAVVSSLKGVGEFLSFLAVALALAGALAWTCVRYARFSIRLSVVLTTLPFMVGVLLTVTALCSGAPAGFLIQAVILAVAVVTTWGTARLEKR